ncbi:MAG: hypothetical protein AB8E15_05700 [Bdellovibrionales bacterium]
MIDFFYKAFFIGIFPVTLLAEFQVGVQTCKGSTELVSSFEGNFLWENEFSPKIQVKTALEALESFPLSKKSKKNAVEFLKIANSKVRRQEFYPSSRGYAKESLLIDLSSNCEYFLVAKVRAQKAYFFEQFYKLKDSEKELVLLEMVLGKYLGKSTNVGIRHLAYLLFNQSFSNRTPEEIVELAKSAGLQSLFINNLYISLNKKITFSKEGRVLAAYPAYSGSNEIDQLGDHCYVNNKLPVIWSDKEELISLGVNRCELIVGGYYFKLKKNSRISFKYLCSVGCNCLNTNSRLIEKVYLQPNSKFESKYLRLVVGSSGSLVFSVAQKQEPFQFNGVGGKIFVRNKWVKLFENSKIVFDFGFGFPSFAELHQAILKRVNESNIELFDMVEFYEDQSIKSAFNTDQNKFFIQGKLVVPMPHSVTYFHKNGALSSFVTKTKIQLRRSDGRMKIFESASVVRLDADEYVLQD